MIAKGDRVRHKLANWHGTVMAKRQDRAMVKWDCGATARCYKHNIKYLEKTLK